MTDRPRNVALAVLLTILGFGVGQVYNGEARKAVILNACFFVVCIAILVLVQSSAFALTLPVILVAGGGLFAFALIDAVLGSVKRMRSYELKPYNRVLVYVGLIVVLGLARQVGAQAVREHWVQAFRIPSESMLPTLLVGDHLFVDKRAAARRPDRGEVIVFHHPDEHARIYVDRVVAVGGDEVEMHDKMLSVNGRPLAERFVQHIDPTVHPAGFDPRDNFGPYTVPRDSYFVLGDNRDNSNDSRWWGPVPDSLVIGTVRGTYWSWDAERAAPRLERIGMLVR